MAIHNIEREVRVAAGFDEVWDLIDDVGGVDQWAPPVPLSEAVGVGRGRTAERRCTFDPPKGKKWVREAVVEYDRDAGIHTVELVDGPAKPPFQRVRGAMTLEPVDAHHTSVRLRFEIVTKGPIQWTLAVIGRPMLARTGRQILGGLRDHFDRRAAARP